MKAQSIEEVIKELDKIIASSITNNSPAGYFAALYREVTINVKKGIVKGEFQNGPRMEAFDVIFANRYLAAYHRFHDQQKTSKSWVLAFDYTQNYWIIVLQHLLFGMNAHINLDLGIAAAETQQSFKQPIEDLKHDFDKINALLASLVADIERDLTEIWPLLKYILKLTKKIDTFLINFNMKIARDGAWDFAVKLAKTNTENWNNTIAERDEKVYEIGNLINPKSKIIQFVFKFIRIFERGDVDQKIDILTQK